MIRSMILIFGLVLSSHHAIIAQDQKGRSFRTLQGTGQLGIGFEVRFYDKAMLLANEGIQDELKLADGQKKELKDAWQKHRELVTRMGEDRERIKAELKGKGDEEGMRRYQEGTLAYARRLTRRDEEPLVRILKKDQTARLQQLQIRAGGGQVFLFPEVIDKLVLEPEQLTQIQAIANRSRVLARGASNINVVPDSELAKLDEQSKQRIFETKDMQLKIANGRVKLQTIRETTMTEISKVLDNGQKGTFKQMVGPPFDFNKCLPENFKKKDSDEAEKKATKADVQE